MDAHQDFVYSAKLAEQAKRYDEMLDHMKYIAKLDVELTTSERNLLRIGCKNVVGAKRESWRMLSSMEEKERAKGKEFTARRIAEYRRKVESELTILCNEIILLIDDHLLPSTSQCESRVFYHRMKGDCYRYLAEINAGVEKEKAASDSLKAYDIGIKAASKLAPTNLVRLSLALNFSVLLNDTMKFPKKAFFLAKNAYDEAIPILHNLNEESQKGSMLILEILLENVKLWSYDILENMGMEYLDMYLVHWPVKLKPCNYSAVPPEDDFVPLDLESTWVGMEKCLDLGLCRCIGISNFSTKKIESLLDFASVPPAVNQVEMHPLWRQRKLREFCEDCKIHVSAYSPLGGPGNAWGTTAVVENPIIQSISRKHRSTPAQVALQWGLSKGSSMIVKSFNRERLWENMEALNVKLDDQDLTDIDKMEEWKIMRGEFLVNDSTSPYKTIEDLWDGEI